MPNNTPHERLATLVLGRPVGEFIAEHYADDRSDAWISRALADQTAGDVTVTRETIRQWRLRHEAAKSAHVA